MKTTNELESLNSALGRADWECGAYPWEAAIRTPQTRARALREALAEVTVAGMVALQAVAS